MKRNDVKDNFKIIAKTFAGLEEVLSREIAGLGAKNINIQNRAVTFDGTKKLLYESNLKLRSALRVLKQVTSFNIKNEKDLYDSIRSIHWSTYFPVSDTFAIDSVVHSKFFPHSKYTALKAKDAIADQFRDKYGKRPSVNVDSPSLRINLHIDDRKLTVSFDSSGESLHRRGYRIDKVKAPLNEVLAAGMILLTGWNGESTLIDPMCGSGTIPVEAALIATNTAPGLLQREFGFMKWIDFDSKLWQHLKNEAGTKIVSCGTRIIASDISKKAVETASKNIARAGMNNSIKLLNVPFERLDPDNKGGVILMNPPYGERLKVSGMNGFYSAIGNKLKHSFEGFDAWILSSNKEALKHVGLKTSKRITLYNGPLESKFYKYSLYKGSKKNKPGEMK
jgi:putative N6-adenine-specific DNA methylase